MRAVSGVRGGWLWGVSGVLTAAVLGVPAVVSIGRAGMPHDGGFGVYPRAETTRTFTVSRRVDAVTVDSYGGPVRISAGPVSRVEVTETIAYDSGSGPPEVLASVSGRRLTLADPECGKDHCAVAFTVTVPRGWRSLTVSTGGGPLLIEPAVPGVAPPVSGIFQTGPGAAGKN